MIRKIYTLLILGICLGFMACSDDNEELNSAASEPVIKFPMEQLDVDLNLVDNLPVVAVIKSELGLKSVNMQIKTNTETIDYKTVTEFFNEKSYSLSEELAYDATYEAFIVNVVDKLDRMVTATLPISITKRTSPVMNAQLSRLSLPILNKNLMSPLFSRRLPIASSRGHNSDPIM